MMEITMSHDPFAQFVSYLLGDLSPPKSRANLRYVDGRLAHGNDTTREEILEVIKSCGAVCTQDIIKMSGYPKTTVYKILDQMLATGRVRTVMRRDLTTNGRAIKHYMIKEK